ncbi:MAG: hypothetical protein ACRC5H_09755, partial [Treponemataceae bacterium]
MCLIKKESFNKIWKVLLFIASLMGFGSGFIFLSPTIQHKIVLFAQYFRSKNLDIVKWSSLINDGGVLLVAAFGLFILIFFTHFFELVVKYKNASAISFFVLSFVFLAITISLKATTYSDADSSSELLLAKELANENKLMSTQWYYSTELRVVNTQLISMPLFKLTSNWKLVKILTSLILAVILCFSYWFLLKSLHIKNVVLKYLSSCILLLPISGSVFGLVQGNNYYFPHI